MNPLVLAEGPEPHGPYALTYPQLVIQAARKGYDAAAVSGLRQASLAAMRLFDGIYRAQGTPFICHVTRTASIAMEHGGSADVVIVALLHAAYTHGIFRDGRTGGRSAAHRAEITDAAGAEAEKRISDYTELTFGDADFLKSRIKEAAVLSTDQRTVLFVALANALEDHLDLQMLFRQADGRKDMTGNEGALVIELARALGHDGLARELDEAFQATAKGSVPDGAGPGKSGAYELPEHYRMRKGRLRSGFWEMWRRLSLKVPRDNKVRAGLWRFWKRF